MAKDNNVYSNRIFIGYQDGRLEVRNFGYNSVTYESPTERDIVERIVDCNLNGKFRSDFDKIFRRASK